MTDVRHRLGWRTVRLSHLGRLIRGRGITRADLVPTGIPCLRYGEIYTTYQDILSRLTSYVEEETASKARRLDNGDIIFAASGETSEEIGKAVAWLGRGHAVFGGDTVVLRGHGQDPAFLVHALNAEYVSRQKSRLSKGDAVVHLHAPDLARVLVAIPPIEEQRRIASILLAWDEAIDRVRALRRAWQRRRAALMQKVLPDRRRPGSLVNSQWRQVRLGQVAEVIISNVDKRILPGERPIRLCNYTDVYANDVIRSTMNLMRASATDAEIRKCRLKVGDVLITKDSEDPSDIAVPAIVEDACADLVCGYHLAILRPGAEIEGLFLKYLFELPRNRAYFGARANGATRFGLTLGSIQRAVLDIPDLVIQRRIADVLWTCDVGIRNLSEYLSALTDQKGGLVASLVADRQLTLRRRETERSLK